MLAEVKEERADLIVAGAYGHSRLGEWAFGGVTRNLLRHTRCAAFFATKSGDRDGQPILQQTACGHRVGDGCFHWPGLCVRPGLEWPR